MSVLVSGGAGAIPLATAIALNDAARTRVERLVFNSSSSRHDERPRPQPSIPTFTGQVLACKRIPIFGDRSLERDLSCGDGILRVRDRAKDRRAEWQGLPPKAGDVPRAWVSIERTRVERGCDPKVDVGLGLAHFVRWLREEGVCASS